MTKQEEKADAKLIRISYNTAKYRGYSKDIENYIDTLRSKLITYANNNIIKREDITPELIKSLFRRDITPLLDIVEKRGMSVLNSTASYSLSKLITEKVQEVREGVEREMRMIWDARAGDVRVYHRDEDHIKAEFVTLNEQGRISVNYDALAEACSIYVAQDEKTQALYDRAKKLWEELKALDRDLAAATMDGAQPVRAIGSISGTYDRALIQVEDSTNIWLDLPKFASIDASREHPKNLKHSQNLERYWHIQQMEQ